MHNRVRALLGMAALALGVAAGAAYGQTVTTTEQNLPQGGSDITTTFNSPDSKSVTTQIMTSTPQSKMVKLSNGQPAELESDGMVYVIYPDGARAFAPDGINTLSDGSTISVKDGKRIP